ncbi:apoptotic chromatin condensation inducer in the nucleus-like [Carassius carassius]|uniref:apoptotic chromatin condensation inducer in the nucleus-like n=1 Tax=Carassius carassius TaxID=217509 RepID=UPI00286900A2|nr:apoptotic chromatin condensation inducer in the nucleus-like [Carassius carassius]
MAELEDVTLDGKPLHSLRVADLKTALEQRGLAKSGQKNALIKRLKGALMLENLQRTSTQHIGLQPNSQIGEEMSQNSFIKQYLAKQQELLRQRLEREAREATDADETQSPAGPETDEHMTTKDSTSFIPEKHHIIHSHLSATQAGGGGLPQDPGLMGSHRLDTGPVPVSQESADSKAGRIWHPSFPPGHEEVATPSPPRAVASLSVRVVGQPERQGLPLMMPRSQEREGTAPVEAGPAHSVLQLSRSARAAACAQVDSDDSDEDDDDSDDGNNEWGPTSHAKKSIRTPPVHTPPAAAPQRSRRKLQPPQHIPPQPQPVHQPPLQLRQPTPPPSPPPELSFPLPDTPKQSPNDQDEPAGLAEGAAPGAGVVSPPSLKRQESSSSSRSSSPEPPSTRRPGPLSLLVRKMESEGVFGAQRVEIEEEEEMEVEKQQDGEAEVQDSAQQLVGPGVSVSAPKMPPAQQDAQDSGLLVQRRGKQKSEEKEKVDETSSPFHLTSPTTFPPRSPHIFSEVPPPDSLASSSKPEQMSVLTSGPKSSEDTGMETEASATTSDSKKHEEDTKVKVVEKKPPKPAEESGKALKSPHSTSAERETDETRDRLRREKVSERRSSMPKQASSSDSDSESSSSRSSSCPSQNKSSPPSKKKDEEENRREDIQEEKKAQSSREVKQEALSKPAGQVAMELEGRSHSESAIQQSDHQGTDTSNTRPEESSAVKSFAARKISLSSKTEIASSEAEPVGGASRKRRWGSSTAVTAKKPSISITTESLKTLIPDIKPLQELVVELHPDEGRLSVDEDSSGPREREEPEEDQGLKIRRTVTQIVPSDGQENGQKEMEEEDDEEEPKWTKGETEKQRKQESSPDAPMEIQDGESKKVTPSDSLVRRSISQQKSGVSITIDDPIRTGQLSPPRGKTSNIIHVYNLVRPFTLGQLKELLNRTGKLVEEGFWIDKIKSHCCVTYSTVEEAVATREALHGVKWPTSNPKVLRVDFCEQDELDFHKGIVSSDRAVEGHDPHASGASARPAAHHPLPPANHEKEKERERERDGGALAVRDQWAERERAMERRERTRSEREWDRDKIKDFGKEDRDRMRRSRSRERRRRERGKSKEKRTEKKDKPEEPPVKLLDDLFHKTKAAPCIYWLPLSDEQATQRALERAERIKEREKRRKELQEEEDKKQEEQKERAKGRDREGGNAGVVRRSTEGERDRGKERERERGREAEKRRDGHRGHGSDSKPVVGSRPSQSRSNTSRDRRH